ncbi:hypothetical protein [Embleya sp. NPDC020886]|uniref:hypothetical protein n=1 Tax=Embleya sp. NPDC020886 TaxID=3363980 RepID=UPI0037BCD316
MKAFWWGTAGVGVVVAVGLVVWVSAADLERSSQVAGVIGSVLALAALGVALRQLAMTAPPGPAVESVQARDGSVAARGSVRNAQARDTAPGGAAGPGTSPAAGPGVSATGGSIAAGGDIDGATAQHGP